jgi:MATE family multidrug resistance protein
MKGELGAITRHSVTVLAGQLAVMAFGVTDTVVAGRYSPEALAALSVASAVFATVFVSLMGIFQALLPLWSEQRGAQNFAHMGRSLRQSLYLCVLACALGMGVLLMPEPLLRLTQVPVNLQLDIKNYLAVLALALPPVLLFRIYSTLNQSLGKPQLVTWLQVLSLGVKIPLTIWFTFGAGFLPPLGVVGAAWATLVVNYSMLAVAIYLLKTQSLYQPLAIWQRMEPPHCKQLLQFVRLGVPAGLAILVEITSFTLMALFIARQGTLSSASHQIASNMAAVLYMVPLSIAIATSARVSYWHGAGQPHQARLTANTGFRLAALTGIALAALLLIARHPIASMYSSSPPVIALAASLLVWVALYHTADAIQTFCIFVLRSYRITVLPLAVYCVMLWGLGLAGGYALAYGDVSVVIAGVKKIIGDGIHSAWANQLLMALSHHDHLWPGPLSPAPFWASSATALLMVAGAFSLLLHKALRAP